MIIKNQINIPLPRLRPNSYFRSLMNKLRFLLLVMIAAGLFSCKKDTLLTDPTAKLGFSKDTVMFDTVFTHVGSSTRQLLVYNPHSQKINISSISVAKGANSNFRLNINGVSTRSITNVEIAANDSMYIFVEVTVDPNNKANPFILVDSILFETNGNKQYVDLVAFGQNAHFIYTVPGSLFDSVPQCGTVWKNDLPYVIYGYLPILPGCSFEIDSGCQIYFHANSGIIVFSGGTLIVKGELHHEVVFQGDRLELDYRNIPGQWDRIWFSNLDTNLSLSGKPGSKDNVINYAIIKNGSIGVQCDTVFDPTNTTLTISNTIIENMSTAGILAQGSKIVGTNLVVGNCGNECAALTLGGDYNFRHCTFANYWGLGTTQRTAPAVLLNNYYKTPDSVVIHRNLNAAYFGNCIIYGSNDDEVGLDFKTGANSNYNFENVIIKKTTLVTPSSNFVNLYTTDPLFKDYNNNNYQLGSSSPAIGKGSASVMNQTPALPNDINGNPHTLNPGPDLGAYQH